ncbi:MAG: amidohydrolase family protein [Porticoccaceae bacterium]|nr:amidohydrolase family protein [Porticoccaceae bacterium]
MIDSHQHFWQISRGDYRWLTPELTTLYRDFVPADLAPLLAAAGVEKTVLVQAADSEAETHFMLQLAEQTDFIAGVVGWVDMAADDAAERIGQLAKNPYFKGIRPMIQDIADDDWMLRPALNSAFQALLDHDLSFDALVLPKHLPNLLTLLKCYPRLRTVVDHAAKPDIAGDNTDKWRDDIAAIAEHTSACCKVSGLVTEAGERTSQDDIQPYFNHLYSHFGASRLMWGSDWPVVNLSMDYSQWRALTEALTSALLEQDKQQLLGATAAAFYRIQE